MKVLHVNSDESQGGAARAAHRLYTGQRAAGADARMLVLRKHSKDPYVDTVPMNRLQRLIRRRTLPGERPSQRQYPGYRGVVWSAGRTYTPVPAFAARTHPDVVNLHWLGNGMLSIGAFRKLPRPVVWTLHDMWAVTGGCHYTGDCARYREGCGQCPQLVSADPHDLSFRTWASKRRTWSGLEMTLVTPSRWLADVARSSPFFQNCRIEVIPNGIDLQVFRPYDAAFARDVLRLPAGKKLILFGAYQVDDERKGFRKLAEVLGRLEATEDIELVLFGAQQPVIDTKLPAHHVGSVDNDLLLALLYSAVDVFVAPSLQDNLPNTVMEALACGTPCAAFNIGGMRDMIDHRQTGYLAQPFDTADLAQGIEWALANRDSLSGQARAGAARFDLRLIAARYLALYDELLRGRNGVPSGNAG